MPEPESCGGEGNGGEEVAREFVVARGDASEMLELVEEALDEIALAVDVGIDDAADPHVALAWDVRGRAARLDPLDDGAGKEATVGDDLRRERELFDQMRKGGLVGRLAGREQEAHRQAECIDDRVDLGAQSSTRTADGVIRAPFLPPAACWWARTIEESIR